MTGNARSITGAPVTGDPQAERHDESARGFVSRSPLRSLWNLQGVPIRVVAVRTWNSLIADRLFGHAAELGFYFLFALFPTLFSASSILGMAAQSAHQIYDRLLGYLAILIPTAALGAVLETFNQTTAAATPGKITFGLVAAVWSASVGISAIQDTLNAVYKIQDTRSFIKARIDAIALTILLTSIVTLGLTSLLGGDVAAALAYRFIDYRLLAVAVAEGARIVAWAMATALLTLTFAVIYYWAPDVRVRRWHWLTPGGATGILGWLLASVGLRVYIHFFNSYSITYGSLGAVIILLMWFYITGLMLLVGAEINSEIEAAAAEARTVSPQMHSTAQPNGTG
jgi:membrane protein